MSDQTANTIDKAAKIRPSPASSSTPPARADPHAAHDMSKMNSPKVPPKDPGKK